MKCIKSIFIMTLLSGTLFFSTTSLLTVPEARGAYPEKSIEVAIPYGPGGLTDLSLRIFVKYWVPLLGQNVLIVSKPGGGGLIGAEYVARARSDGYTLGYLSGRQTFPEIYAKRHPFNADDFKPLFQVIFGVPSIAVRSDSPWRSLDDFIRYAKANPGVQYAHTGRGATPHLTAGKLAQVAGLKLDGVPYGGDRMALTALLGGDTRVGFFNLPAAVPHHLAGKIRVLAIHSPQRMSSVPEVATFRELGVDMPLGVLTFTGMFAPKGIPEEARAHLIRTAREAGNNPALAKDLNKLGAFPNFSTGGEFEKVRRQYRGVVADLVRELGLYQE